MKNKNRKKISTKTEFEWLLEDFENEIENLKDDIEMSLDSLQDIQTELKKVLKKRKKS